MASTGDFNLAIDRRDAGGRVSAREIPDQGFTQPAGGRSKAHLAGEQLPCLLLVTRRREIRDG
jgi:hypothetical protein